MNKKLVPLLVASLTISNYGFAKHKPLEEKELKSHPLMSPFMKELVRDYLLYYMNARPSESLFDLLLSAKKSGKEFDFFVKVIDHLDKNLQSKKTSSVIPIQDVNYSTISEMTLRSIRNMLVSLADKVYFPIAHDVAVMFENSKIKTIHYSEEAETCYGANIINEKPEEPLKNYRKRYTNLNAGIVVLNDEEVPYAILSMYQLNDSEKKYLSVFPLYANLERAEPKTIKVELPESFDLEELNNYKIHVAYVKDKFVVLLLGKFNSYAIIDNSLIKINEDIGLMVHTKKETEIDVRADQNDDIILTIRDPNTMFVLVFVKQNGKYELLKNELLITRYKYNPFSV
ncbi:MAG: hypothetical protein N3E37_03780 [Candidatus Micrarchaeota archaeon]|nr:hypothetical protein [Candidatus Micrarchaeota archaeon]